MNSQYQEVNTREEGSQKRKSFSSVFKQAVICSVIVVQYFVAGLCVGSTTVLIPQFRKEHNSTDIIDEDMNSWLYSASSVGMLPCVIFLPLLTKYFGRKLPQMINSFFCLIIFIALYYSDSPYWVIGAEVMQGYLHSDNIIIAILIITEYASPELRGLFLTSTGASFFWGMWIANLLGTFFHWKVITQLGFVCSLYTFSVFLWPESPYWLASKGRIEECKVAFRRLHGFEAEKELQELIVTTEERLQYEKTRVKMTVREIILCPEFYKPLTLSLVTILQYQFSGKMICSFYILDIFKEITSSESTAYTAMLILNGVTVVSMYFGSYLCKILTRRTLLLTSTFLGIATMLLSSSYLFLSKRNLVVENNYVVLVLLTAYSIFMSCGPLILSMSLYGELISSKFQSGSYIIVTFFVASSNVILYKITPIFFVHLGLEGSFLMYSIVCGLCTFYLYLYLPETKNKTRWQIEDYFKEKVLNTNLIPQGEV